MLQSSLYKSFLNGNELSTLKIQKVEKFFSKILLSRTIKTDDI
jgi:hypothetical protein